jgi:hypothetical protein
MKSTRQLIFLVILAILILPSLQNKFHFITSKKLQGDMAPVAVPQFSWKSWFKGEYQRGKIVHIEDSIGFKSDLVRLYNQIDFSLFSIPHAATIVYGKNNNFFAEHYIRAYLGDYYIGKPYIDLHAWEFKRLQDILWKTKKIMLVVLFAPDKGSFMPENFPDRYKKRPRTGPSNHDMWVRKCREYGVNYIDYTGWFLKLKDTCRFPLIPKMGMHWSYYGAYIAADTMVSYLEKKMNTTLLHPILDSIHWSDDYKYHDNEVTNTMNLIWPRKYMKMPYPFYHYKSDTTIYRPNALVISDSYNWHWFEENLNDRIFRKHEFWYYFKDCYPESWTKPTTTDGIDLKKEIEKYNVILILQVNGGAGKMGFEFLDRAYDIYDTTDLNPIRKIEKKIYGDPKWLDQLKDNAKKKNITLEEEVRDNAIYLVDKDLLRFYKNY